MVVVILLGLASRNVYCLGDKCCVKIALWPVPGPISRTEQFFKEFSESLLIADSVLITEIFASRELNNDSVNSQIIVDEMLELGHKSVSPTTLENLVDDVESIYKKGDIILTIGAGNIWRYSDLIKERLL